MEQHLRDYHARRILADIIPFEYDGRMFYLTSPTSEFKYYAEIIYQKIYNNAKLRNISMDNVVVLLNKYGMWDESDENNLTNFNKDLENTKVSLYENYLDYEKRYFYKNIIRDLNVAIEELYHKKSQMNYVTAEHTAFVAKQKFIVGASILKPNKKRLWTKITDWNKENKIIDCAFIKLNENVLSENDIRDIVKSEPWKTIWSVSNKSYSLFKKSVSDLSSEQSNIFIWSVVYDNIHKSQNDLSQEIIEDNDALDGWMILQKRKKESNEDKKEIMSQIDPAMSKYETVFIVPKNESQIKKIYEMNDFAGKMAVKQRLVNIQRDGVVDEINMIDRRQQIAMQASAMYARGLRR